MKDLYDQALCSCWQSAKQGGGITEHVWLLGVWDQISLIYSPEQLLHSDQAASRIVMGAIRRNHHHAVLKW